jgi:ElaB/YqjD/DUF883 family membrane-anchored ribosome-binding protein
MDQESDLSEQRPEEIRDQIEETRSDLTEKLEALEHKVMDTVAEARGAVADTVATVKQSVDSTVQAVQDTVHDTVDSMKHALDLGRQVDRHPWAMLGGSLVAGYVLGCLLRQRQSVSPAIVQRSLEAFPQRPEAPRPSPGFQAARSDPEPRVPEPSLLSEFTEQFAPEMQKLKRLAIGTLMALARDRIKQSVAPALASELGQVMDRVTSKLGGEPLLGPVLDLPGERAYAGNQTGR